MKIFKKNYKIFLLLLVLISPLICLIILQEANATENTLSEIELNRYIESAEKIKKVVSSSVFILPELDMISSEIIDNLLEKTYKYDNFLNNYTRDVEKEGGILFDDLLNGYRVNRKMFYLVKDINSLAKAFQNNYELINTTEIFLETNRELVERTEEFEDLILKNRENLNDNLKDVESLLSSIVTDIKIERDYYDNDIDNLVFLRNDLQNIVNNYLSLSADIIKVSQNISESIENNLIITKIKECELGGGEYDEKLSVCICEDGLKWEEFKKECIK